MAEKKQVRIEKDIYERIWSQKFINKVSDLQKMGCRVRCSNQRAYYDCGRLSQTIRNRGRWVDWKGETERYKKTNVELMRNLETVNPLCIVLALDYLKHTRFLLKKHGESYEVMKMASVSWKFFLASKKTHWNQTKYQFWLSSEELKYSYIIYLKPPVFCLCAYDLCLLTATLCYRIRCIKVYNKALNLQPTILSSASRY